MSELYLMTVIAARDRLPEFVSTVKSLGSETGFITLGSGTAGNDVLDMLGLAASEKAVMMSFVTDEAWSGLKSDFEKKIRIDIPGTGIAFIVPLSSVGGPGVLRFLTDGLDYRKEDESSLKDTARELLVVIANQGYNEAVMDAARSAGAHGGTIIHARGTGMRKAEKFLGISLASEKEVILIVTASSERKAIMSAVMEQAGVNTPAQAIVFSLPVTDAAGLRLIEDN